MKFAFLHSALAIMIAFAACSAGAIGLSACTKESPSTASPAQQASTALDAAPMAFDLVAPATHALVTDVAPIPAAGFVADASASTPADAAKVEAPSTLNARLERVLLQEGLRWAAVHGLRHPVIATRRILLYRPALPLYIGVQQPWRRAAGTYLPMHC